jgi:hypothetical protein
MGYVNNFLNLRLFHLYILLYYLSLTSPISYLLIYFTIIDKYSCTIQHWVSSGDLLNGPWAYSNSVVVSSDAPCFGLIGGAEDGDFVLYTSTSSLYATVSTIFRIDIRTSEVTTLKSAPFGSVYRSVSFVPKPRFNYTCPVGQFGKSCDRACAYDCCAPCTPSISCPPGQHFEVRCSTESDNVCVPDSPSVSPSYVPPSSASNTRKPGTPTRTRSQTPSSGSGNTRSSVNVGAAVGVPIALVSVAGLSLFFYARSTGTTMFGAASNLGSQFSSFLSGSSTTNIPVGGISPNAGFAGSSAASERAYAAARLMSTTKSYGSA